MRHLIIVKCDHNIYIQSKLDINKSREFVRKKRVIHTRVTGGLGFELITVLPRFLPSENVLILDKFTFPVSYKIYYLLEDHGRIAIVNKYTRY